MPSHRRPRRGFRMPYIGGVTAVSVDQTGTAVLSPSGTSYDYTGLHVTAGLTKPAIVIAVTTADMNGPASMTATWDNTGTPQAMTGMNAGGSPVFVDSGSQIEIFLFGLLAPHADVGGVARTCHLSWTTAAVLNIGALSLYNVNQSAFTSAFQNPTSNGVGSVTSGNLAVTSAPNHLALCVGGTDQFLSSMTPGTNWPIYAGGAPVYGARAAYAPGASPNVTFTGGLSASGRLFMAGIDVFT